MRLFQKLCSRIPNWTPRMLSQDGKLWPKQLFLWFMRNTEEERVEEFEDVLGAVVDIPLILFITDERRSHSPEQQHFLVGNSPECCPPPASGQLSREDRHGKKAQLPQLSLAPWHHFSRREKNQNKTKQSALIHFPFARDILRRPQITPKLCDEGEFKIPLPTWPSLVSYSHSALHPRDSRAMWQMTTCRHLLWYQLNRNNTCTHEAQSWTALTHSYLLGGLDPHWK